MSKSWLKQTAVIKSVHVLRYTVTYDKMTSLKSRKIGWTADIEALQALQYVARHFNWPFVLFFQYVGIGNKERQKRAEC